MAVKWRKDSVAELRTQKSRAEPQKENEELQAKVASLETQVTDTQLALWDVYEHAIMVAGAGEV